MECVIPRTAGGEKLSKPSHSSPWITSQERSRSLTDLPGNGEDHVSIFLDLQGTGEGAVVLPNTAVPDDGKVQLFRHLTLEA